MNKSFTTGAEPSAHIHLYTKTGFAGLDSDPFQNARAIASNQTFTGAQGQLVLVPGADGAVANVLFGIGDGDDALSAASLAASLPEGDYAISSDGGMSMEQIAIGWADGSYQFRRYLKPRESQPRLVLDENIAERASLLAGAIDNLRDLVNTPAADMTPADIQVAVEALGVRFDANVQSIIGEDLLDQNFPLIHAVGRAAEVAPRLVHLTWGDPSHPKVSLVGKGVSFDTGGLNIKTGDYMRIMKKDMGGAAHVIALSELIMVSGLPVHLNLFVPTVENAVAGNAFRPGDVIRARNGKTVEIDNTDAEGRLILADALTRASEDDPDLLIDYATLTGAARVALGPDLAPLYTDDDTLAADIIAASATVGDPVWRMPLWDPYFAQMKSPIADMQNSGGRMGGSITAGLFLKQFVDAKSWAHLDVWAWRLRKYNRPEGAAAIGLRGMFAMLEARYGHRV